MDLDELISIVLEPPNYSTLSIGKQIRIHRQNHGMTATELAKKARVSRVYLSRVEKDSYMPPQKFINKVCNILDLYEQIEGLKGDYDD